MTDEEIKKAFITCLTDTSWDGCINCSYHEHYPNKCNFLLQKDGLDLIERLEAENAELRATLSKMETVEKELRARLEKAMKLSEPQIYTSFSGMIVKYYTVKEHAELYDTPEQAEARLAELKGGRE